jgi:hypothetical protein
VPGKSWVGERLAMRMPLETFRKLIAAKDVAIKMGSTVFQLSEEHKTILTRLNERMR